MDGGAWQAAVHGVARSRIRLSNFTFTFHFHALKKELVTHSNVLAWRIPGMREPGGLPSMGLHRIRHNWSDLEAAAAESIMWKARLHEAQAGIKIAGRHINNLRYADVLTTLMAETWLLMSHLSIHGWGNTNPFSAWPKYPRSWDYRYILLQSSVSAF